MLGTNRAQRRRAGASTATAISVERERSDDTIQSLGRRATRSSPAHRFSRDLVTRIEDSLSTIALEDAPALLSDLWRARRRLEEPAHQVTLNASERRTLVDVERSLTRFLRSCGPDVYETQQLIGRWAESGLLHVDERRPGLTLEQLVDALAILHADISMRLSSARNKTGRPKNRGFDRFCTDVAVALLAAGEPLRRTRTGSLARLIHVLLYSAGRCAPRDLFRHVQKAVAAAPGELRARNIHRDSLQKLIQQARRLRRVQ